MARSKKPAKGKRRPHKSRLDYRLFLPVLVVAAGIVAYHNSFSGAFVLDDRRTIIENPRIRSFWNLRDVVGGARRPVVELSLAANYAVDGLDVRSYHAFNLVVHLLAGITLFGIVRRTLLTERLRGRFGPAAPWLALAVSSVWVVHPLQTQSVTYVIQRSESMMGLFYLLTMYCVIRGAALGRGPWWYVAAICCCGLGMGSKAVMVTAPVVVLLYDGLFLAQSFAQALRRRWWLYVGLAGTWVILVVCGIVQGVLFPGGRYATVGFGYQGVTPWEYARTQPGVIVHYLRLSLWPDRLCLDHGWPVAQTAGDVVAPAIVVSALLAATLWALKRRHWAGFAGAWFFVILSPTSSFVPIRDLLFEHRMYLPLAAVIVVVIAGAYAALTWLSRRMVRNEQTWRLVAGVLIVTATVALTVSTIRRNRVYRSEVTMWSDIARKAPHHARAHTNLGFALATEGRFEEAVTAYHEALRIEPEGHVAHYNLANALVRLGRADEACEHYAEAARLKEDYTEAYVNWADALERLGREDEAIDVYRAALANKAASPRVDVLLKVHVNLGNLLSRRGQLDEAIEQYNQALRLKPDHFRTYYNLGLALEGLGRIEEAVQAYQEALRHRPDHQGSRDRLAALTRGQQGPSRP